MNEEKLFHLALDRAPDERTAFLESCTGDLALRRRIGILLAAHDHPDSFLVRPALETHQTPDTNHESQQPALGPGMRIASYRLHHLIGEGGMGAVYLAEPEH